MAPLSKRCSRCCALTAAVVAELLAGRCSVAPRCKLFERPPLLLYRCSPSGNHQSSVYRGAEVLLTKSLALS